MSHKEMTWALFIYKDHHFRWGRLGWHKVYVNLYGILRIGYFMRIFFVVLGKLLFSDIYWCYGDSRWGLRYNSRTPGLY